MRSNGPKHQIVRSQRASWRLIRASNSSKCHPTDTFPFKASTPILGRLAHADLGCRGCRRRPDMARVRPHVDGGTFGSRAATHFVFWSELPGVRSLSALQLVDAGNYAVRACVIPDRVGAAFSNFLAAAGRTGAVRRLLLVTAVLWSDEAGRSGEVRRGEARDSRSSVRFI